jgi:SAM-dependent methyltransferase
MIWLQRNFGYGLGQAAASNPRTKSDAEEEKYWQENAHAYDERNPLAPYTQLMIRMVYEDLKLDDHLLEVGPGTGGFTQLLAPYVQAITLVEPSAVMYRKFCRSWTDTDYPLPEVVAAKWEEASFLKADIVFSANAVYRIRDMKEYLIKMNQTARRHIFLVQLVGRPFAGRFSLILMGLRLNGSVRLRY